MSERACQCACALTACEDITIALAVVVVQIPYVNYLMIARTCLSLESSDFVKSWHPIVATHSQRLVASPLRHKRNFGEVF